MVEKIDNGCKSRKWLYNLEDGCKSKKWLKI
jgi:hypothetical protein